MRLRTDIPSRNDVEVALQQLEIEDEREREAIRAFWARERECIKLSLGWRYVLAFCAAAVAAGLFYWFLLAPAIDALTGQ